jgi:diguanylate cyclase (GGDEF)-like protein
VGAALAIAHGVLYLRGGAGFTFAVSGPTRLAFLLIVAPAVAGIIGLLRARVNAALTALEVANARLLAEIEAKKELAARLEELAFRDALTGLMNRRAMLETLAREVRRAERKSRPLSVLMIDVDHFKRFNDSQGHLVGDRVLREIAVHTSAFFRGDDVVCRFGGEELVAILPEAGGADGLARAEALRRTIEELALDVGEAEPARVTVSIGVACYPEHGGLVEELLRAADEALYEAKRAGRNQVRAGSPRRAVRDRSHTLRLVSG